MSSVNSTRWCSLSLKQQTSYLVQLWVIVLQVWGLRVTGILVTHCEWQWLWLLRGKAQSDLQGLKCFREWSGYSRQRGPFGINQDNYLKLSIQKTRFFVKASAPQWDCELSVTQWLVQTSHCCSPSECWANLRRGPIFKKTKLKLNYNIRHFLNY